MQDACLHPTVRAGLRQREYFHHVGRILRLSAEGGLFQACSHGTKPLAISINLLVRWEPPLDPPLLQLVKESVQMSQLMARCCSLTTPLSRGEGPTLSASAFIVRFGEWTSEV